MAERTKFQSVVTDFNATIKKLIEYHPAYASEIQDGFWYVDVMPIRKGEKGAPNGVDIGELEVVIDRSHTNEYGYWIPQKDVARNIVLRAETEEQKHRLRVVQSSEGNRNFHKFHSRFNSSLMYREINDAVRVTKFDGKKLHIQKATYLDQLGTNITADMPLEADDPDWQKTPRQIDTYADGRLKPFEECICANTIGVCGLFLDKNLNVVTALRNLKLSKKGENDVSRRLGAMESGWHCYTSGVLKWQDIQGGAQETGRSNFVSGLELGLAREIEEETGIRQDQGHYEIFPYAFARELKRPGKPQFFFVIHFPEMTAQEIFSMTNENMNNGAVPEEIEYQMRGGGPLRSKKSRIVRYLKNSMTQMNLTSLKSESLLIVGGNSFTYELYGSLKIFIDGRIKI